MQITKRICSFLSLAILLIGCSGEDLPPTGTNARASDIALADIGLDQNFHPTLLNYTATAGFANATTTVTTGLFDERATITVNGSAVENGVASEDVSLDFGSTTITVVITADNGVTTTTYKIDVTRQNPDADARASDIGLAGIELDQIFQPTQLNYTATVSLLDSTTTVTTRLFDARATIAVNGNTVENDAASDEITLDHGITTITVVVTAYDGVTTTTYAIVVTRQTAERFAQTAYIKASNTHSQMRFGRRVDMDGNTLVVGAPGERGNDSQGGACDGYDSSDCGEGYGAVYVFTRDASGIWRQQGYLKASNAEEGDGFGSSVALEGNTLAIGAPGEASNAIGIDGDQSNNKAKSSGAAYVFTRDVNGMWSQQAYIKASNTNPDDLFGGSIALEGGTLAIGAPGEASNATGIDGDQSNNNKPRSGAVYLFARDASGLWSQQAYLKASNTSWDDGFGRSVTLQGGALAVGAWHEDSSATGVNGDQSNNLAVESGAVYVFTRAASGLWSQQAYLKASNTEAGDWFGWSVTLDGDTLAVGAIGEDSAATGINGDQSNGKENKAGSGAVYVFTRDVADQWSQQAYVKASRTGSNDSFGGSVALKGDTLVVGAPGEDSDATGINGNPSNNRAPSSGAVSLFTRDASGVWSQQAYIKASNTDSGDAFGGSVALEGDKLVVGAQFEDSNARGIEGDQSNNSKQASGAVYVFE